jgi:hypothetical protein
MKRLIASTTIASLISLGLLGCSEAKKSTSKQETTIATPSGKTTITTEKEVKQTGESPPKSTP